MSEIERVAERLRVDREALTRDRQALARDREALDRRVAATDNRTLALETDRANLERENAVLERHREAVQILGQELTRAVQEVQRSAAVVIVAHQQALRAAAGLPPPTLPAVAAPPRRGQFGRCLRGSWDRTKRISVRQVVGVAYLCQFLAIFVAAIVLGHKVYSETWAIIGATEIVSATVVGLVIAYELNKFCTRVEPVERVEPDLEAAQPSNDATERANGAGIREPNDLPRTPRKKTAEIHTSTAEAQ